HVRDNFAANEREKAENISRVFLQARILGLTPKTQFYQVTRDHYIAAKPDLQWAGRYFEFKTCPIDEYARLQARIFALVCRVKSIVLAGFHDDRAQITRVRAVKGEYAERMANKFVTHFTPSEKSTRYARDELDYLELQGDDDLEDDEDDEIFFWS
nr:hypothetical protein [Candidatus Sigynarchaeota archaeon]